MSQSNKMTLTIHLIAAARPNFMKVAPLLHALARKTWYRPVLVHTGQHYDANMSDTILRGLGAPPRRASRSTRDAGSATRS